MCPDYGNDNNNYADVILDDYITFDYSAHYRLYDTIDLFFKANLKSGLGARIFCQELKEAAWVLHELNQGFSKSVIRVV